MTGTSAEVVGVSAIDDHHFGVGPVTRELANAYQDVVHGRDATEIKVVELRERALRRPKNIELLDRFKVGQTTDAGALLFVNPCFTLLF